TRTGEAVLPPLSVELRRASAPDHEATAEQRYPVGAWLLEGTPAGERPTRGRALALAASCVVNLRALGAERALGDLSELEGRVAYILSPGDQTAALELVRSVADDR